LDFGGMTGMMPRARRPFLNQFASKALSIARQWRPLKREAAFLHDLQDGCQAKRGIDHEIGFYNAERSHTTHGKQTP